MDKICIPLSLIYTDRIRENPLNPRKSAFHNFLIKARKISVSATTSPSL
ncbi:MAG: hypothetical protein FWG87_12725 [Defluviitaleaceae bacterium]|nr:hypothetical protein [Defluviitaleaceae bacterium]